MFDGSGGVRYCEATSLAYDMTAPPSENRRPLKMAEGLRHDGAIERKPSPTERKQMRSHLSLTGDRVKLGG
jgi:hypothetical protein